MFYGICDAQAVHYSAVPCPFWGEGGGGQRGGKANHTFFVGFPFLGREGGAGKRCLLLGAEGDGWRV